MSNLEQRSLNLLNHFVKDGISFIDAVWQVAKRTGIDEQELIKIYEAQ